MGSLKQKARDNFAAIELTRKLDVEGREATEAERRVLVKYVGWGGIPQAFADFGPEEWRAEREQLKSLLTPAEYESARASTLNAHYTAAGVVGGIYEAVRRLGFDGGRVLEPALGIGHFFGLMPSEMAARSRLTGIELDPLSAHIARHLYPDADIRAEGFETAKLVEGSFDLAISNVPFGDYKLRDPRFDERNFLIHDYFFAKGLDQVRPGGLIVFITSKGTLDKVNSGLRYYLSDKADLLGAIRLPNTAFKQNANTEVTTDIIFLRKLEEGEKPGGPPWQKLSEHINRDGVAFQINEYFVSNPHMMLGSMALAGTMYRANEAALVPDGRDLTVALREAVANLPQGIYRRQQVVVSQAGEGATILAPDFVKENAFTLHEGQLAVRTGATLTPLAKLAEETERRIRGLIKVRDAVREVLRTQIQERGEEAITDARRQLNLHYDSFVLRFGAVNESANRRAFRSDPDYPLLCSLEDYNEETKQAAKTAIFRERTIQQARAPQAAETPKDALVMVLNETGRVNLERMEALLRRPKEEFLPELAGLLYRNPQTEEWETDDQYLSGDVRAKLENARTAAQLDPGYRGNVAALEAVQPGDLMASDIEARLGAVWIPARDIEEFAKVILGADGINVSHAAVVGTWFVKGDYGARGTVANSTEWGTSRYSALELIQDALNLKTPTVYDTDPRTKASVINATETEAARDKLEKIKERFKSWIWESDERRERLCRKYNDEFNSVRLRVFNGSHLKLPGQAATLSLSGRTRRMQFGASSKAITRSWRTRLVLGKPTRW